VENLEGVVRGCWSEQGALPSETHSVRSRSSSQLQFAFAKGTSEHRAAVGDPKKTTKGNISRREHSGERTETGGSWDFPWEHQPEISCVGSRMTICERAESADASAIVRNMPWFINDWPKSERDLPCEDGVCVGGGRP
jgi:hypothetical protein